MTETSCRRMFGFVPDHPGQVNARMQTEQYTVAVYVVAEASAERIGCMKVALDPIEEIIASFELARPQNDRRLKGSGVRYISEPHSSGPENLTELTSSWRA